MIREKEALKGVKPLRSIMQAFDTKNITSIFLLHTVTLGFVACFSALVNPVPGNRRQLGGMALPRR